MVDNPRWYPERDITKWVDNRVDKTAQNQETERDIETSFRNIVATTASSNMISESDEAYLRSVAEVAPMAFSIMSIEELLREAAIWKV